MHKVNNKNKGGDFLAVKEILKDGNSILRRKCRRIVNITEEDKAVIQDLKDTLYAGNGVGLAAPQIGYLKRIFIVDLRDGSEPIIMINPKIVKKIGTSEDIEGCLSYPGYEGIVVRPRKIVVSGSNENGKLVKLEVTGFLARAICHETDHLDGVMYMDNAKTIYKIQAEDM
jgi:peptide deformylase